MFASGSFFLSVPHKPTTLLNESHSPKCSIPNDFDLGIRNRSRKSMHPPLQHEKGNYLAMRIIVDIVGRESMLNLVDDRVG
ncbi:hypothetical protein LIER_18021 [Lithospermum erythrorhizon]|uniref:Uncharacterized protein n=1 Tax=Lithospermum erythrorhizon TaxID=34254 RepID=A0AAV3QCJ2_LITER